MIPRVCIICGEVWHPRLDDGDYQDACPRCRKHQLGALAEIEAINKINALPKTEATDDCVAVPRETLERWMEDLHRVGLTLSSTRAALGIRDELKALLSTSAEKGPGVERSKK